MLKLKGFRFRLKPSRHARRLLACAVGSRRFVWNRALSLQKQRLDEKKPILSYHELCKLLTQWKQDEETSWLKDQPSQPLQQTLRDLFRALGNGLSRKCGMPHFKCKGRGESLRYPQGVRIEGKRIYLPKIGFVPFRKSQEVIGTIKNVTVKFDAGHWDVSIQTEREVSKPIHPSTSQIGIDLGVCTFAYSSDGEIYPSLGLNARFEHRLRREQRALSRKQKGSRNRYKQLLRYARLWRRIRNVRQDYLHKITTELSKNHAVVFVEDLRIQEMSQSNRGTKEEPGTGVAKKARLNRAILEQAWGEFTRQLAYKLAWRGGKLILVDPRNTSISCPECGHVDRKNRPTRARFCCTKCSYEAHADLVGARNVLAVGHTVSACGANGLNRAIAQEPFRL